MSCHTAVGVDDDFASGETAVANGTTNDELAGGVYVIASVGMQPGLGQHRLNNRLHDGFVNLRLGDLWAVLGGEHHCIDTGRCTVAAIT